MKIIILFLSIYVSHICLASDTRDYTQIEDKIPNPDFIRQEREHAKQEGAMFAAYNRHFTSDHIAQEQPLIRYNFWLSIFIAYYTNKPLN